MNKLITALQRLYFLPGQQWCSQKSAAGGEPASDAEGVLTPLIVANGLAGETDVLLNVVSPEGAVRTMVMNFDRAADWEQVGHLYQAVQDELDLPAPAVSVSGHQGYGVWFSLAEPVPVAQAQVFLNALRLKYLADLPATKLHLRPEIEPPAAAVQSLMKLTPTRHKATGKWSAYIDPSLVGMFVDGPWLEMAPNMDRQADILAGLKSIAAGDFQRALSLLQAPPEPDVAPSPMESSANLQNEAAAQSGRAVGPTRATLNVGNNFHDPQSFLLAVMNDSSASARQRIKAAKALLPYFARVPAK